jgi:hypothetical protein
VLNRAPHHEDLSFASLNTTTWTFILCLIVHHAT